MHYIGRTYIFITDGGWEVSGRIIEFSDASILIETEGRVIKLDRSKIIGETAMGLANAQLQPLVPASAPRYDIREAAAMPLPAVAKAKLGPGPAATDLQERLGEATVEAVELREELGITETLSDERKQARTRERKTSGSIIPEHMLLPEDGEEAEQPEFETEDLESSKEISIGDLSASFGVDFRKNIRGQFDEG